MIEEIMQMKGIDIPTLSQRSGISILELRLIQQHRIPISKDIAYRLAKGLEISPTAFTIEKPKKPNIIIPKTIIFLIEYRYIIFFFALLILLTKVRLLN
jgi:transcriptional regulator with XRE-family HTH domain